MFVTFMVNDIVRYLNIDDLDEFMKWITAVSEAKSAVYGRVPTLMVQSLSQDAILVVLEYENKEVKKRVEKQKENIWKLEDEKPIKQETVHHPKHYQTCNIECFDLMKLIFGEARTNSFCLMNAFKYIYRFREKGGEEDLKKAEQYLDFYAAESIDEDDLEDGELCRNDELYNELMELIEKYTGRL